MQSLTLVSLLSALASQALASNAVSPFGVSPVWAPLEERAAEPQSGDDMAKRDVDRQCFSSVLTKLSPPEPSDTALSDWATSAADDVAVPSCTITAPASLSSQYVSYVDVVRTWLETVESKAGEVDTLCGADYFSLSFTAYCSSSITVFFTESATTSPARTSATGTAATGSDSDSETETATATRRASSSPSGLGATAGSTVLEPLDVPTGTIRISAAAPRRGVLGVAVAMAGVLGLMLAL